MKNAVGFSEGCEGISPLLCLVLFSWLPTLPRGSADPEGGDGWFLALPWVWACGDPQGRRGCSMPWPCRQVRWSSAAPSSCSGCSSPLCLLHMEERWGQHVCQLEDEFFGSLLFREGSLSPHGLWLPGRLKMPPLSHHLSQTESPVCHTHPFWHPSGPGYPYVMLCANTQDFQKLWALCWNWGNIFT